MKWFVAIYWTHQKRLLKSLSPAARSAIKCTNK